MAEKYFSGEVAENYEQKCLCVLVLDTSGSMNEIIDNSNVVDTGRTIQVDGQTYNVVEGGISKLDKLNEGLERFYKEIEEDDTTSQRLELAIITFNDNAEVIQSPALICNCSHPTLEADGFTALVDGMNEAINLVAARKQWYKDTNQTYYRPWIILMTDGEPNDDQDISALATRIKEDTAAKRYQFLPIGVDEANMEVLQRIQGQIPAMKLEGAKFSSFFKWLSASMGTVVTTNVGGTTNLPKADDWMSAFEV